MRVLFVAWDGPQVSYLEGLFLPIFQQLAHKGVQFQVLQFTWGDERKGGQVREACEAVGVGYRAVRVWRKPVALGAMLTAFKGSRAIRRTMREWDIDTVMPRSTLPALATLLALRGSNARMVFDADGLPLDERVDFGGRSASSLVYCLLRDIEAQAVRRANIVLTRSSRAVDILYARAGAVAVPGKFHVVSNGRNADLFSSHDEKTRRSARARLGLEQTAPLLVYAGSLGEQYCLPEMLRLFETVYKRRPDARFVIMTSSPETVASTLCHFPHLAAAIISLSVAPDDVPEYLACADLGLALRQPSFSMQAVAPIKLGEYLLCGLPVIATNGIGDTAAVAGNAGYLVGEMTAEELQNAANWFVDIVLPSRESFRHHCSQVGRDHFSLEACVESYMVALRQVMP